MAKVQKRRTISVKGLTYQRLHDYCEAEGVPVSGYLEQLIAERLDREGVPVPTVLKPKTPRERERETEEIVSQHFTF
jgi:hypothetical protein